ncbi:putative integral membrane protein [Acidisarcina polymorpha]|uniref:Putative integral membrane protein n=1 Tax=Acidisarcina polymorpha TaxID=2211140 RepID=A0A2Z5G4Z4_9BACT|nr:DMT family transporter [Acidisarcina polymorpha]AXC13904.1 putative integral membrane protein [Acidisarcina polymorpha]
MRFPRWLLWSLAVPLLWGLWGALTEIPEKWLDPPFPPTLGYAVWSLTMLPFCFIALSKIGWRLTPSARAIGYGCAVGFSGAAGQLLLFWVLRDGPAYLIFPIICLSPAVTIVLSFVLLKERTYPMALTGILLSLPAILLLAIQEPTTASAHGYFWLVLTIAIFLMWGLQAYFMKSSANAISSEELFFYMTVTGIALSPFAIAMNGGFQGSSIKGVGWTAIIQTLNAAGCLLFVYAVREGKAIIVVPTVNGLFPLVTIVVSLLIYRKLPGGYNLAGILLALIAVLLMAFDEVRHTSDVRVESSTPNLPVKAVD